MGRRENRGARIIGYGTWPNVVIKWDSEKERGWERGRVVIEEAIVV